MKQLGFVKELIPLVLSGQKYISWRVNDDKDLSANDTIQLVEMITREPFAKAKIISVKNTTFGKLTPDDRDGHEKFTSEKEMLDTYSGYYGQKITADTPLKVIKFKLIQPLTLD